MATSQGVGGVPAEVAATKTLSRVKIVAILNLVTAGFALLLTGLWFIEIFLAASGALEEGSPHPPPRGVMVLIFVGLFLLAAVATVLHLVGGLALLKRKPGCRKWGLVTGITGCASLAWGCCCCAPLPLGVGIYTLIIVCGKDAKNVLPS